MKNFLLTLLLCSLALGDQQMTISPDKKHDNDVIPKEITRDDMDRAMHSPFRGRAESANQNQIDDIHYNINAMATRTTIALDNLMTYAIRQLHDRGYDDDADQIDADWNTANVGFGPTGYRLFIVNNVKDGRAIGDFAPLSTWLDQVETKIEQLIGYPVAHMLHLTDIKSFNFGIPVVFFTRGCVGKEEYGEHFVGGPDLNGNYIDGLFSVTSYWLVFITCEVATWGGGWFIICSPLAGIIEFGVEKWVGPPLSDWVYGRVCGQ